MYFDYFGPFKEIFAVFGGFIITCGVIMLALLFLCFISLWKLFKKVGYNGWEALVPFYNIWILVKISELNWWWFLIILLTYASDSSFLFTLAGTFALFNCYYNICKKFDKGWGFAVCMTLFPFVCLPIIGLSNNSKFNSSVCVNPNGIINEDGSIDIRCTDNHSNDNDDMSAKTPKFCDKCGTKLNASSKFCSNCGKKVK